MQKKNSRRTEIGIEKLQLTKAIYIKDTNDWKMIINKHNVVFNWATKHKKRRGFNVCR